LRPGDAIDGLWLPAMSSLFQSAPGLEAGRCDEVRAKLDEIERFNPRPALRPGDALTESCWISRMMGFNPRPALRPGDASVAL